MIYGIWYMVYGIWYMVRYGGRGWKENEEIKKEGAFVIDRFCKTTVGKDVLGWTCAHQTTASWCTSPHVFLIILFFLFLSTRVGGTWHSMHKLTDKTTKHEKSSHTKTECSPQRQKMLFLARSVHTRLFGWDLLFGYCWKPPSSWDLRKNTQLFKKKNQQVKERSTGKKKPRPTING